MNDMNDKLQVETNRIPIRRPFQLLQIILHGDLQYGQQTDLKTHILNSLDETIRGVVIDLAEVSVIDSAGLGLLAALNPRLAARKAPLVLVGVNPHLENIITLSGMNGLFVMMGNLEEAIAFFTARLSAQEPPAL